MAVGTLTAVTASNAAWGLAVGRAITLHVVSISSSLNIGEFENLAHYVRRIARASHASHRACPPMRLNHATSCDA